MEIFNALTNYFFIMRKLDRVLLLAYAKMNDMSEETWSHFTYGHYVIQDKFDDIKRQPKYHNIIIDVIAHLNEEQPGQLYPGVSYTIKDYIDMLWFGRELTKFFLWVEPYMPDFEHDEEFSWYDDPFDDVRKPDARV